MGYFYLLVSIFSRWFKASLTLLLVFISLICFAPSLKVVATGAGMPVTANVPRLSSATCIALAVLEKFIAPGGAVCMPLFSPS